MLILEDSLKDIPQNFLQNPLVSDNHNESSVSAQHL